MQRGHISSRNGAWYLYYREGGQLRCHRLGAVSGKTRSVPAEIQVVADKILEPVNLRHRSPEAMMSLRQFIEHQYLPDAKSKLRPSTYRDYEHIYNQHIKNRIGERVRLCDFTTPMAQDVLDSVHSSHSALTHKRLLRIRAMLSAIFTCAMRKGVLLPSNPVHATKAPGRQTKFRGGVYSLEEILRQLDAVRRGESSWLAVALISVAAFTGLRASELRGLRWGDFDGENLNVKRSVWGRHVGPTKTAEAEDSIPVLPLLKNILSGFRNGASDSDYIFAGPKTRRTQMPLNLNNFSKRILKPAFRKHNLAWRGYHAYRRSLASTLYGMDVSPKVIARILRHSSIGTTLQFYVQTDEKESVAALAKIQGKMVDLFQSFSSAEKSFRLGPVAQSVRAADS